MKKKVELKIRISLLVLWLCSLTASVYAIEPQMLDKNAGDDSSIRGIPATGSENSKDGTLPGQSVTSGVDFRLGVSPLSVGNEESVQKEADLTSEKQPDEQEVGAIVDNVLSRMVEAGLSADLSQALAYISTGDYAALANFQKENPEILNALSDSLRQLSATYSGSNAGKNYLNGWKKEIDRIRKYGFESQPGGGSSAPSVEAVTKLYQPIAERISEVTESLEEARRVSGNSGRKKSSSADLLRNFSDKAKEFVLKSLDQAQANLEDGMLSGPLEKTAFAAETILTLKPGDVAETRERTATELYVRSRQYRVVDSVYMGKDFIYAQKMLHPPTNLHPYLKWLLYTRNLTPRMVENYLATREAIGAIYAQAKAGQGNIRYRDKVYGAFLPFAETAAGNYELVKPASDQ